MYARIAFSSRPTVFTKYPRAQKCCPTKFCFRSPYVRARWIALLPLMYPTTCDTAYFGGMESKLMHVIWHQMPFLDVRLLLRRELTEDFPEMPPQFLIQHLTAALWNKHNMIFAVPSRMV